MPSGNAVALVNQERSLGDCCELSPIWDCSCLSITSHQEGALLLNDKQEGNQMGYFPKCIPASAFSQRHLLSCTNGCRKSNKRNFSSLITFLGFKSPIIKKIQMISAQLCVSKINIAFFPQRPLHKGKRGKRLNRALRAAEMLCLGFICSGLRRPP